MTNILPNSRVSNNAAVGKNELKNRVKAQKEDAEMIKFEASNLKKTKEVNDAISDELTNFNDIMDEEQEKQGVENNPPSGIPDRFPPFISIPGDEIHLHTEQDSIQAQPREYTETPGSYTNPSIPYEDTSQGTKIR